VGSEAPCGFRKPSGQTRIHFCLASKINASITRKIQCWIIAKHPAGFVALWAGFVALWAGFVALWAGFVALWVGFVALWVGLERFEMDAADQEPKAKLVRNPVDPHKLQG
jgi:hypothetical protein